MYLMSVTLPRASGLPRRTSIPSMTPVVHVGRAYSHPNQRGIPTASAAMTRTELPRAQGSRAGRCNRQIAKSRAWAQTATADETVQNSVKQKNKVYGWIRQNLAPNTGEVRRQTT